MKLLCFPTPTGKVNLTKEVGPNYLMLGIFLLEDATGQKTSAIELEHSRNAVRITHHIFELWLRGEGRQPVSWDTLVTVLRDLDLNMLADVIEKNV